MVNTSGLDEGWLYIFNNDHTNYMKILINGKISHDEGVDPIIENLPGNYRYGYNLNYFEREIGVDGVYFLSYEDYEKFKMNLASWNRNKLYISIINNYEFITGTATGTDATNDRLSDTSRDFLNDGVREGDILEITSGDDNGKEFLISEIVSSTQIGVFGDITVDSGTPTYSIHRGTMFDSYKSGFIAGTSTSIVGSTEILNDTTQTFVTDGVVVGDYLEILEGDNEGVYLISNVAETALTVSGNLDDETDDTRQYEVYNPMNRYIMCFYTGGKRFEKEFGGEGDIWTIAKLTFKQA